MKKDVKNIGDWVQALIIPSAAKMLALLRNPPDQARRGMNPPPT